jgi:hypothetical protein
MRRLSSSSVTGRRRSVADAPSRKRRAEMIFVAAPRDKNLSAISSASQKGVAYSRRAAACIACRIIAQYKKGTSPRPQARSDKSLDLTPLRGAGRSTPVLINSGAANRPMYLPIVNSIRLHRPCTGERGRAAPATGVAGHAKSRTLRTGVTYEKKHGDRNLRALRVLRGRRGQRRMGRLKAAPTIIDAHRLAQDRTCARTLSGSRMPAASVPPA